MQLSRIGFGNLKGFEELKGFGAVRGLSFY